jgi:acyl-coenzyme A thioesterase PaaI-like protein
MQISENTLKWAMRFYPPLLFQRIWVKSFDDGFRGVEVKIFRSLLNTNYNNSIFGGSIFSASDPFFAVLFDQVLLRRGYKIRVWLKSAHISYLKPGRTDLSFRISLSEADIQEAETALKTIGKFVKSFPIEITGKNGEICARVTNEVYVRNLLKGEKVTIDY